MHPEPPPRQPFQVSSAARSNLATVNYETAVYVEDVQALTDELLAVIAERAGHIPAGHIRDAIIGAALITAAQTLDELPAPAVLWKRGGITGMIRHIVAKWQ
jgi:hypothetical protein